MYDENALAAVICASDLAQLVLCAADEARPQERLQIFDDEMRAVLENVGANRLPANPRAVPLLITVALGLAHGAAGRDQ